MPEHTDVRTQELPVPEPGLTPEAIIARARALIPAIRDQQDEAEAIVLRAGERYAELATRWAETGEPFTREDDVRLYAMVQQAGQLAVRAVEVIFAAASSSAAKRGHRLQRYYRDASMYHGHIAAQYMTTAGELARVHFGLPDSLF
jgi:3-hydroxy-9,10-secoandrosta-1,3,5(10)-triene-9,17-dione monooxygenase